MLFSTSPNDATCSGVVPNVGIWFAWLSELNKCTAVQRREERTKLCAVNRTRSRTHTFACIFTRFSLQTKLRPHWCSGVQEPRTQPLAPWHRCCERLEGEHLPHRPESFGQQCGRRRRRCSCKSPAGNGFDVQEVCVCVCVHGVRLLLQQMSLRKVV